MPNAKLNAAKTKLVAAFKARKGVQTGDALTFTDRWYLVVNAEGKPLQTYADTAAGGVWVPAIFRTRAEARTFQNIGDGKKAGERIVRLNDISGEVVK